MKPVHLLTLTLVLFAHGPLVAEEVVLGDPGLFDGIRTYSSPSLEEVRRWLDDENNHAELEPRLPLGLDAGRADIKGIEQNPLTRAKIELGRQLFFDKRLSVDRTLNCASCHEPELAYATRERFGVGAQTGHRNPPALYNRVLSDQQFRDGRAATLEEQSVLPIADPTEMGLSHEACVERLAAVEGYRLQFERIFGEGVSIQNVGQALAAFERTLVTGPSAWDYHSRLQALEESLEGEELTEEDRREHSLLRRGALRHPLSESARRGSELFFSDRIGCARCHVGANFTDEQYHNLGVGLEQSVGPDDSSADWGRFAVTQADSDRGAFKTPTLRNVAQTPPYMHDGSLKTLHEVVEWYTGGGRDNPWLSDKIEPLDLDPQEIDDLVAFLEALTGELPLVRSDKLLE